MYEFVVAWYQQTDEDRFLVQGRAWADSPEQAVEAQRYLVSGNLGILYATVRRVYR